uniref:Uncharacterized protein n=1 Tax=Plectus sambesii TaxID=2011161 RepID=A0A914VHK7_9BILA
MKASAKLLSVFNVINLIRTYNILRAVYVVLALCCAFFGFIRLSDVFDRLEAFKQETTLKTKDTDDMFEMPTPELSKTFYQLSILCILLLLYCAFAVANFFADLGKNRSRAISDDDETNMQQRNRTWKIIILKIATVVLEVVVVVSCVRTINFLESNSLLNEIVGLLGTASDKNPAGLTEIEKILQCCRTMTKTNRTVYGTSTCDEKVIPCNDAVLNDVKMAKKISIGILIVMILTILFSVAILASKIIKAMLRKPRDSPRVCDQPNVIELSALNPEQVRFETNREAFNSGNSHCTYYSAQEEIDEN